MTSHNLDQSSLPVRPARIFGYSKPNVVFFCFKRCFFCLNIGIASDKIYIVNTYIDRSKTGDGWYCVATAGIENMGLRAYDIDQSTI